MAFGSLSNCIASYLNSLNLHSFNDRKKFVEGSRSLTCLKVSSYLVKPLSFQLQSQLIRTSDVWEVSHATPPAA